MCLGMDDSILKAFPWKIQTKTVDVMKHNPIFFPDFLC
jgi:hypothetical protein